MVSNQAEENENGKTEWLKAGWTADWIRPTGESLEDLEWALEKMLKEVRKCKEDEERLLHLTEDAEAEIKA